MRGLERGHRATAHAVTGTVTDDLHRAAGCDRDGEPRLLLAGARRTDLAATGELDVDAVAMVDGDHDLAAGRRQGGAGVEGADDVGGRGSVGGHGEGTPLRHADSVTVALPLQVDHGHRRHLGVRASGRGGDDEE